MAIGRKVVPPFSGDGDAGYGFRRYGRVCAEEAEYGCAIHCNTTDSRPLRRDGKDAGGVGVNKVMVTGGPGPGRIEGGNVSSGIRWGRGRAVERVDGVAGY